uniref:Uncharacterized protein n=1 Tax=Parascaris univalens TaxID=6257 RepID=A0A915AS33_PARUN
MRNSTVRTSLVLKSNLRRYRSQSLAEPMQKLCRLLSSGRSRSLHPMMKMTTTFFQLQLNQVDRLQFFSAEALAQRSLHRLHFRSRRLLRKTVLQR